MGKDYIEKSLSWGGWIVIYRELIADSRPLACSAGYQIYFYKLFGSFNQFNMHFYRWAHFKKSQSLL